LRPEGTEWATWLSSTSGGSYDWEVAKLAVFTAWGEEALFVDVDATDINALLAGLGAELQTERIRLANAFGRIADDVFIDQIGEWRRLLSNDETKRLLESTPQGIAQLGQD
jgi:hypothetical protein